MEQKQDGKHDGKCKKQKERTHENRNRQDGRKERWVQLATLGLIQQKLKKKSKLLVLKEPKMAQRNNLINQWEKWEQENGGEWRLLQKQRVAKHRWKRDIPSRLELLSYCLWLMAGLTIITNYCSIVIIHLHVCQLKKTEFLYSLGIFRKWNSQEVLLGELFTLVISLHSISEMNQINRIGGKILLIKDCRESSKYVRFYKVT